MIMYKVILLSSAKCLRPPLYRQVHNVQFLHTLLKPHGMGFRLNVGTMRHFSGGIVTRIAARLLKVRYLVLGAGASGAYSLNQKYEQIRDSFPDLGVFSDYFPERERVDSAVASFRNSYRRVFSANKNAYDFVKSKAGQSLTTFEEWFHRPATASEFTDGPEGEDFRPLVGSSSAGDAKSQVATIKGESDSIKEMKDEIMQNEIRYQKSTEKIEKEIRELRKENLLLRSSKQGSHKSKLKKSLIDMYSEVLDELGDFDEAYNAQDQLPRVVVVGDQSSGKTSVLEMIAQARIFPRGSGEMMTRSPVKVTLSEGPYHVASFKDSSREFDLTKEADLDALRHEIEVRMKRQLGDGQTISTRTIALNVQGPGLQRMVLVDLPGIISTVTVGMNQDTRDAIRDLAKQHMENPNAIILCIQDGSIDAERSNVTDLVSSMDPQGKRTIFVLTKVDLAEANLLNPGRIKQILEGRLFPMKALGYFAVVTGKGNKDDSISNINEYEEHFFRQSRLFREGVLKSGQMTTANLSRAVSERFWKMVKESVEQQADAYKATRYNLEIEWKNTFRGIRLLDREELFEKAKNELLDELISLSAISPQAWEQAFHDRLWAKISDYVFDSIVIPSHQAENSGVFHTMVDIKLRDWTEHRLPQDCVTVGWETLYDQLHRLSEADKKRPQHDAIFDRLKEAVHAESFKQHTWDEKAERSLRVIQTTALEDQTVHTKPHWDSAIKFMQSAVEKKLQEADRVVHNLCGPSTTEQWLYWRSKTDVQRNRSAVMDELNRLLQSFPKHASILAPDELTTVRKNLQVKSIDVDNDFIREAWLPLHKRHLLQRTLSVCHDCTKGFYYYHYGFDKEQKESTATGTDCREVVLFWRLHRMLEATSNALRQQVMNNETRRLERIIKEVLDEIGEDPIRLDELVTGKRVQLAEDLKRVRHIQEKLEEFILALGRER